MTQLITVVCFFALVALLAFMGKIPVVFLSGYLVASLITFLAYAWDKSAAQRHAWRVQESTLHLLALLGGWPGALLAQEKLRHKTQKEPFRRIFWVTVALNCIALGLLMTPQGMAVFKYGARLLAHF